MAESTQDQKVTLHWLNGSRAQGTLWLLEELGISYELEVYHREKSMRAPPELQKVNPLGKAPVVTIGSIVLAETAFISQYLCDHFGQGKTLVPKRWKDGLEGKIGGETEEWMRYQYLMYYTEGSFMPYPWMHLIMSRLKGPDIPWLIRPISSTIANKVISLLVYPNMKMHLSLLEKQLATSPGEGKYLCGPNLTAADIGLAFPLLSARPAFAEMGSWEKGTPQATFPKLWEYMDRIEAEPGWKRSAEKIREIEGDYKLTP